MAVKFFGQFLIEKDLITNDSLLHAIELQERTNLKLGEMALAMELITTSDIQKAHNAQLSKDMKLGDLLVDLGILTSAQLQEVIARQKATHIYIGEALVKVGALTAESLEKALEAFKADQAPYVSDKVDLPDWLTENRQTVEIIIDLTYKMITRVLGIQFRPGNCQNISRVSKNFMLASMDLSGDLSTRYILSVSKGMQKTIAKAILKEENVDNEIIEVLEDTVMEFVNIVCGNVVAKASQMGITLEISPPETVRTDPNGLPVTPGSKGILFPIHLNDNETMEVALFINQL